MNKVSQPYSVEELLPHRDPMIFIDQVTAVESDAAESVTHFSADHIIAVDQGIPAYAGLEVMAQTIAAWAGFHDLEAGRDVKVGFLLGSRKYKASRPFFNVGEKLTTHIKLQLQADNGLSSFKCSIHAHDEEVCSADIKVFKPGDNNE